VIDDLLALLESPAARRAYDERVSQVAHALQCADLATAAGAGDALVAAALLHDVGHLLDTGTAHVGTEADDRHEATGARHLRERFGPEVTAPIALHVAAKRYLCATDPAYLAALSDGSRHSLALQGGPMTADEVTAFEARPHWEAAVRLRRWDDQAKVPGLATSAVADHRPLLERLARRG
jgi:phosphonate degradation associated HDIG domain protein